MLISLLILLHIFIFFLFNAYWNNSSIIGSVMSASSLPVPVPTNNKNLTNGAVHFNGDPMFNSHGSDLALSSRWVLNI